MYCHNCGARLPDDARFCSKCGAQQNSPVSAPSGEGYRQPTTASRSTSSRVSYDPYAQGTSRRTEPVHPGNGRGSGKSSAAVIIAVILGIGLAAVLGYLVWQHFKAEPEPMSETAVTEEIKPTAPSSFKKESDGVFSKPTQKPEASPKTEHTPEPESTPVPTPEPTPEPETIHDPAAFSSEEKPTLGDFLWANPDTLRGNLPEDRQTLTELDEVSGGWKVYIIDYADESGSMMERLCTAHIGERDGQASIVIDWFYVHDGSVDQGFDDNTPDTLYVGDWEDGSMDVVGPGRIRMKEFYLFDGKEYAIGSLMWEDGMTSAVLMTRP